jgi:hypothetical protein
VREPADTEGREVESVIGAVRHGQFRSRGITLLAATWCAFGAAGCGGSGHSHPPVSLRSEMESAVIGQPASGNWESTTVHRLQLGPIRLPRGAASVTTITTKAVATASVVFVPQGGRSTLSGQSLIPPAGMSVTAAGSVTADVARDARGKWKVYSAQFTFAPPPVQVRHAPAIHALVRHAIRTLFTFSGDRRAYAQAQHPYYALPSAASPQPTVGGAPTPSNLLGFPGDLFAPRCPRGDIALVPSNMSPAQVRISPKTKLVSSVPLVLQVRGTVRVSTEGWKGVSATAPLAAPDIPCGSATATVRFDATVVKSMVSGKWLIGELGATGNNPDVSGGSVDGIYLGIGVD